MSRTQIAWTFTLIYAVTGLIAGGSLKVYVLLMFITCGPLALHYLTNPMVKESDQ